MVIGIEKSAVKREWKRKIRANPSWLVQRLLETGAKPLALLSAASLRSRPAQDSQAKPRRLFQCMALERWGATSGTKGDISSTLDGAVKEGALWVLRITAGDWRK